MPCFGRAHPNILCIVASPSRWHLLWQVNVLCIRYPLYTNSVHRAEAHRSLQKVKANIFRQFYAYHQFSPAFQCMLTKGDEDEGHIQSGMVLDYDAFEPQQVQFTSVAPSSPTTSMGYTSSSAVSEPETLVKTESHSRIPFLTPRQMPWAPKAPTSPVHVAVSPIARSRSQPAQSTLSHSTSNLGTDKTNSLLMTMLKKKCVDQCKCQKTLLSLACHCWVFLYFLLHCLTNPTNQRVMKENLGQVKVYSGNQHGKRYFQSAMFPKTRLMIWQWVGSLISVAISNV